MQENIKHDHNFCCQCKRERHIKYFYKGKSSPCKECHILIVKRWQKRNPDKVAEYKERQLEKLRKK